MAMNQSHESASNELPFASANVVGANPKINTRGPRQIQLAHPTTNHRDNTSSSSRRTLDRSSTCQQSQEQNRPLNRELESHGSCQNSIELQILGNQSQAVDQINTGPAGLPASRARVSLDADVASLSMASGNSAMPPSRQYLTGKRPHRYAEKRRTRQRLCTKLDEYRSKKSNFDDPRR